MDNTKFTNIVLSIGIIIFIVMGIVSLNLNYEGIENQNQILIRQDRAAEHHRAAENSTNSFIQENIIGKENVQEIKQKLDIILNQTK